MSFATWRSERNEVEDSERERYELSAPTGGAIDMSLSLRMTISRVSREPALFIAS